MQIVQIWCEAESLYGAIDIFLNMGGRIGNSPESAIRSPKASKAAF